MNKKRNVHEKSNKKNVCRRQSHFLYAQLAEEAVSLWWMSGGLRNAELLESLAKPWITLAYQQWIGPNIAIKLLRW